MRAEECYRLPYPDQEECLRQADVGYDEYQKDRDGARRRAVENLPVEDDEVKKE